jgi:hypothetical protein
MQNSIEDHDLLSLIEDLPMSAIDHSCALKVRLEVKLNNYMQEQD